MAATKRNSMLIEEARGKIQTTQLINRLQDHALGKVEMTKSQVTATAILLRKKLPDLTSSELTIDDKRETTDWTREELVALLSNARNGGGRAVEADGCLEQPDKIH